MAPSFATALTAKTSAAVGSSEGAGMLPARQRSAALTWLGKRSQQLFKTQV